jgi:ABC-type Fe3+/spermidine/putrescine transport system ATPase subunit
VADFIGEMNFINGKIKDVQGGAAQVSVGDSLTLSTNCDQSLPNGTEVSLAVRPEKMHINASESNGNTFKARVISVVYIGTDTHYGVEISGGQHLRVREQNNMPGSRPLAQTGDEVTVSFAAAAGRLLTE